MTGTAASITIGLLCGLVCQAGAQHAWSGRIDTLPSGTVVVANTGGGLWGSSTPWLAVEDLRIGSVDGTEATAFGRISSLAVDRVGRIYVLDRQAQQVRIFRPDGRYIRTTGRRGSGPGELQGADDIWVDDSLRLWVSDPRSLRLSVFDSTGRLIADYRRDAPPGHVPRLVGGEATGALWDSWGVSFTDPVTQQTEATYLILGRPADTLRLPEFRVPLWRAVRRQGASTSIFNLPVPFSAEQLLAADPRGGIWRSVSAEYRITRFMRTGDSALVVIKTYRPVPVTRRDRESAVARYRRDFPDPEASTDPSLIPAVRPAMRALLIDDRGFIWVAPAEAADSNAVAFDVFDPSGRYLGVVPTPVGSHRLRPRPVVRADALYYVATDDLDVQYVVRVRIAGRR